MIFMVSQEQLQTLSHKLQEFMNIYDIDKINSEMSMFAKASDLEKLVHDTTQ